MSDWFSRRPLLWAACLACAAAPAAAQDTLMENGHVVAADSVAESAAEGHFRAPLDSVLEVLHEKGGGRHGAGLRLVVSLERRHLWAILGPDTLLSAPVATAMGTTLRYAGRAWTFETPRGVRHVLRKKLDPVWMPPDWLYAETAKEHGLKLAFLPEDRPVVLRDGTKLLVRDGYAGLIFPGEHTFEPLPTDEHIVFDETLYIPPSGTKNRQIEGELGAYALDLGDGYMLHGTPHKRSIGTASTHGCVRLHDEDIEWLYDVIPVGTPVYITP